MQDNIYLNQSCQNKFNIYSFKSWSTIVAKESWPWWFATWQGSSTLGKEKGGRKDEYYIGLESYNNGIKIKASLCII